MWRGPKGTDRFAFLGLREPPGKRPDHLERGQRNGGHVTDGNLLHAG